MREEKYGGYWGKLCKDKKLARVVIWNVSVKCSRENKTWSVWDVYKNICGIIMGTAYGLGPWKIQNVDFSIVDIYE